MKPPPTLHNTPTPKIAVCVVAAHYVPCIVPYLSTDTTRQHVNLETKKDLANKISYIATARVDLLRRDTQQQ